MDERERIALIRWNRRQATEVRHLSARLRGLRNRNAELAQANADLTIRLKVTDLWLKNAMSQLLADDAGTSA
jgi:hypothetical protein